MLLLIISLLVVSCYQQPAVPVTPVQPEQAVPAAPGNTAQETMLTTHQLQISGYQFLPSNLEIKVGDTVEWINNDPTTHTITFDNGEIDQQLANGETLSHTFSTAGEYSFHCRIHSSMKGIIVVR